MQQDLVKELQGIGLSDKEAKAYLAGLELGPATAQQIAAKATVNRPSAYIAIESLIKRGLMSSFQKGKKRYFTIAAPAEFLRLKNYEIENLNREKERVREILPLLDKISNWSQTPQVTVYEGSNGLITMQAELVRTAKEFKKIENFAAVDQARDLIEEKALADLWKSLNITDIQIRTLYSSETSNHGFNNPKYKNWKSKRITSDALPFEGELTICGDKVFAFTFKQQIVGVIIHNADIAKMFTALFDLAWYSRKTVD